MLIEDELFHYGIIRRSGRYPWGSGEDENTHNRNFVSYVAELRKAGISDAKIAEAFGMSTTDFRAENSIAKAQQRQAKRDEAWRLHEKGMSNVAAAARMGIPEPTFRTLIAPGTKDKEDNLASITDMLREETNAKKMIQVGTGVEYTIGVSSTKLATATARLQMEGYEVHTVPVRQLGTGKDTKMKVLAVPGTTWGDVRRNSDQVQLIRRTSEDGGRIFDKGFMPPIAVNPKRVEVIYGAEGAKADGVIYVRPGVDDLSLGGNKYAQVRVQIGKDHYLKGMAVQKDDLPPGIDIQFNTPKADTGNVLDAMKPLKDDPDLPFGSIVRQLKADIGGPKERVTSAMNIVNDESDWEKWSRTLSSQMLSKQDPNLAKGQLAMTYERRRQRFDEIMALTNPTVRRELLKEFAEGVDTAAVHLKAASLPGQSTHVILPLSSIKPTEVFAPNYANGTRVVLVRHPHGGTFEIPELTVNNRVREGNRLIGKDSKTAIGIHHTVAQRLSGADFDGDTVLVIPNNLGKVKTSPALEGLKDFDPKAAYPAYPGMKKIKNMQTEMGKISNLITDMTIRKASQSEIAQAIRHSMVIIDSEKDAGLDYRQSYKDNGIKHLKDKYQRLPDSTGRGASTLISRAKSPLKVDERVERRPSRGGPIDPRTGAKVYEPTGRTTQDGRPRKTETTRLAEATDARTLSSGTRMEAIYAAHSNQLKALANRARLEQINTPRIARSPSAAKAYAPRVAELDAALSIAIQNAPYERQAQAIAGAKVRAKRQANPDLDKATIKKIESHALNEARVVTGAKKTQIKITPEQWEAIQAGAISDSKLTEILRHADMEIVNQLATPKTPVLMTPAKTNRAAAMLAQGRTRQEVATALGVSLTTLDAAT